MNNKKLTNTEIIKALDEAELFLRNRVKDGQPIKLSENDVGKLRNISQACAKAYDEINQLQTEKENLKVENQSLRSAANSLKMHYEEAQAEIERLQKEVNLVSIQFQDIQERQEESQAEIDKLNAENMLTMSERNAFRTSFYDVLKQLKTAKAEVYKECLANVKNYIKAHCNPYGKPDFDYDTSIKILNFIDKLVKQMVGENNV